MIRFSRTPAPSLVSRPRVTAVTVRHLSAMSLLLDLRPPTGKIAQKGGEIIPIPVTILFLKED
jgi:hypothetical protein